MQVLRTDICMDVGQSLNPSIDIGQASGAEQLRCWMWAAAVGIEMATFKKPLGAGERGGANSVRCAAQQEGHLACPVAGPAWLLLASLRPLINNARLHPPCR